LIEVSYIEKQDVENTCLKLALCFYALHIGDFVFCPGISVEAKFFGTTLTAFHLKTWLILQLPFHISTSHSTQRISYMWRLDVHYMKKSTLSKLERMMSHYKKTNVFAFNCTETMYL